MYIKYSMAVTVFFTITLFSLPLQVDAAYGPGDAIGDAFTTTDPLSSDEIEAMLKEPQLNIKLPGLEKFSEANVENLTTEDDQGNKYLTIPYAGDYIAAAYRFAVAAVAIVSIIMIVFAGFQWMTSAGNSDAVTKAKSRIEHSLIGIILAVGSYLFLYTINPNLVAFKNLKVLYVTAKPIPEALSHGEVDTENSGYTPSGNYGSEPSGELFSIPGTNINVPLTKKDLCFLNTFGKTQTELNGNISEVTFLGSKIKIHKIVAPELQKRFFEIEHSTDPSIKAWISHLKDPNSHKEKNKSYNPVNASGAFMKNGHGSDIKFIKQFGPQFGISVSSGGIANTILGAYTKEKLYTSGITSYVDKNGVTRKTKKASNYLSHGMHAMGLSFDIDYPHNAYGKTPTIPAAAAAILERDNFMKWGLKFKDPAHFEYTVPQC